MYAYFEYHRHYGHDIYLITQNARKLPPDITCLSEYIITAAPRSRSVIGEFKYKWLSDGEILKREGFRPDDGIFALYKSMDQKESEKIKNPVMRTAGLTLLAIAAVMLCGLYYFKVKWLDAGLDSKSASPASTQPGPKPSSITSSSIVASASAPSPSIVPPGYRRLEFSSTSVILNGVSTVFLVFNNRFVALSSLPYKFERVLGTYVANVPISDIENMKPEERTAPSPGRNESGSGSAHPETVAVNQNPTS